MKAMEIPVMENGERVGTLRVSAKGLYTLFEARLPPAAALSRLWLLGKNGSAAHLGLLAPCPSGRVFSRRLTRLECSRLPAAPMMALVLPNGEKPRPSGKAEEGRPQSSTAGDRKVNAGPRLPHPEVTWRNLPDGSMIDRKRRLLALPWAGEKLPCGVRKILRNGKEYWLFRY